MLECFFAVCNRTHPREVASILSKDRCLGLMYASPVVNDAVQRQKGCIIFMRFYAELTFLSLGRLAPFVESVFANATRAFARMPSSMNEKPIFRGGNFIYLSLVECCLISQATPTQAKKRVSQMIPSIGLLGCRFLCLVRIQVFQWTFQVIEFRVFHNLFEKSQMPSTND